MKNVFFIVAFLLGGAFMHANIGVNLNDNVANKTVSFGSNVDFNPSADMLQSDAINISKISSLLLKVKSVRYLDGCGNWWIITYDDADISDFDAFILAGNAIYMLTGC